MREYGVERVWRDARLNRIGAGTDEIMLDVIGRSYGL
jgi:alkylation response protein AidB-like acyl-CoA dehydrogenase